MRIKQLQLYTRNLEAQLAFYTQSLGLSLLVQTKDSFSVQVGWSVLSFTSTDDFIPYHFCFLIPCNQLEEGLAWMDAQHHVLNNEDGRRVHHFDTWNADAFYFYDADGNLAECIARHGLENQSDQDFGPLSLLCINEIGMPTDQIAEVDTLLSKEMGSQFWKGDLSRFGTHGDEEGLLLLPNYKKKKTWFPTQMEVQQAPFEAVLEHEGNQYNLLYNDEVII